jgi:hypothetical protein
MRSLLMVFLLAGVIAAPAGAQRAISAGRGGGFSASHGFSAPHIGGGFGSGFHFAPTPTFAPRNYGSLPQYRFNMPVRPMSAPQYRMPTGDWRHGYRPPYRYRSAYRPYFYANPTYLFPGYLNSYWGYPDSTASDEYDEDSTQQAQSDDYSYNNQQGREEYVPPRPPVEPSAPLAEAAITLVFKDGHSQQVHNYAMTKSTLYVLDDAASGRQPEIPLSNLDVAATEKANRDSGVDFRFPLTAN